MWFLYTIIGIYLILPIINIYICNANKININYFISIWFWFYCVFPLLSKFGYPVGVHLEFGSGYLGYLIVGYKLRCMYIDSLYKVSIECYRIALLVFVSNVLFTMISTYYMTVSNNGILDEFFYGYLSMNIVFMTISFIIVVIYINNNLSIDKFKVVVNIINYFSSKLSFGIYLVHLLVMAILDSGILGFKLNGYTYNPAVFIPVTTVAITLLSSFFVCILKKVPVIKLLVP